jgi:hypothetical protein
VPIIAENVEIGSPSMNDESNLKKHETRNRILRSERYSNCSDFPNSLENPTLTNFVQNILEVKNIIPDSIIQAQSKEKMTNSLL